MFFHAHEPILELAASIIEVLGENLALKIVEKRSCIETTHSVGRNSLNNRFNQNFYLLERVASPLILKVFVTPFPLYN